MLTKSDLKGIDNLFIKRFREELKPVREEFSKQLQEELKPVKTDLSKLKKDTEAIISFFDHEYLSLHKRIERIEEHLNLPPLRPYL